MGRFQGAVLFCLGAFPLVAQPEPVRPGDERFIFALGIVLDSFHTDLRVNNSSGQGSNVNLRDDLGVEREKSSAWVSAEWRFAPRHRIGLNFSSFDLSGTTTAKRQIQIDDETYPAGSTLETQFKLNVVPVLYSYSFLKDEHHELAATAGLHWSYIKFKANGSASSGPGADREASAKVNAPLPLLGLRYDHHFSQRWSAGLQGGVFSLKFGEDTTHVKGDIWQVAAYGEYRFASNLGVGLTIQGVNLDVEASSDSWRGAINYRVWGPQLYLKFRL